VRGRGGWLPGLDDSAFGVERDFEFNFEYADF
jgi:hypothetical protein